jgi:hypothetical protein
MSAANTIAEPGAVSNTSRSSRNNAAAEVAASVTSTTPTTVREYEDGYWKKLQRDDQKRLEIIGWVEQPFWQMLFHWNGTVLKALAGDSLLWITMLIFIGVRILERLDMVRCCC